MKNTCKNCGVDNAPLKKCCANWRINSVWHDTDDRSIKIDNDKEVVLLLENGKLIEYDDDWEQYCCIAVKWAYKENLLPNK